MRTEFLPKKHDPVIRQEWTPPNMKPAACGDSGADTYMSDAAVGCGTAPKRLFHSVAIELKFHRLPAAPFEPVLSHVPHELRLQPLGTKLTAHV